MPSAVIKSTSYDEHTGTLRVTYVSGLVYAYRNVPAKVYAAMRAAFSKGRFLNEFIKGEYPFERLGHD